MAVFVSSCHLPSGPSVPGEGAEADTTAKSCARSCSIPSISGWDVGSGVGRPVPACLFSAASANTVWTFVEPLDSDDTSLCWAPGCRGQVLGGVVVPARQPRLTRVSPGCWAGVGIHGSGRLAAVDQPVCQELQGPGLQTRGGYLVKHSTVPSSVPVWAESVADTFPSWMPTSSTSGYGLCIFASAILFFEHVLQHSDL